MKEERSKVRCHFFYLLITTHYSLKILLTNYHSPLTKYFFYLLITTHHLLKRSKNLYGQIGSLHYILDSQITILELQNLFCGTLRLLREPKIILPQTPLIFAEKFIEVVDCKSNYDSRLSILKLQNLFKNNFPVISFTAVA